MKKHVIAGFIVHWLFVPLWSLILPLSTPAYAGLDDTIALIEALTANRQKVAVIVMHMQAKFMDPNNGDFAFFLDEGFYKVLNDQAALISHFSSNKDVYFVNVKYAERRLGVADPSFGETLPELLSTMKQSSNFVVWYNSEYPVWRDPRTKRKYSNFIEVDIPQPGGAAEAAAGPKNTFYKVEDYLESEGIQQALIMGSDISQQSQKVAKELAKAEVEVLCDRELLQIYRHRSIGYGVTDSQGRKYIQKDNRKAWEALVKKYRMKIRLIEKTPDKCLSLQSPG